MLFSNVLYTAKAWNTDIAGHKELEFCWAQKEICFQILLAQATRQQTGLCAWDDQERFRVDLGNAGRVAKYRW